MIDFLVVGQGLAGSCMAYKLVKQGYKVKILDNNHFHSSTKVSAGIINPVTGRRYAFSWRYHDILAQALSDYDAMGSELGCTLYEPVRIRRRVASIEALNDLSLKFDDEEYKDYISVPKDFETSKPYVDIAGYRLNVTLLLSKIRTWLEDLNTLVSTEVDYDDFRIIGSDHVSYQEKYHAGGVIFCEGAQGITNPWIPRDVLIPFHGQIIKGTMSKGMSKDLVKDGFFLVPMEEGGFWFGSIDERDRKTLNYDLSAYKKLVHELHSRIDPALINHLSGESGIRPTTQDRHPIVGRIPGKPIYILNGLGTKGSSLAPYTSEYLLSIILQSGTIDGELDISRFM